MKTRYLQALPLYRLPILASMIALASGLPHPSEASTVVLGEADATNIQAYVGVTGSVAGVAIAPDAVADELNRTGVSSPIPSIHTLNLLNESASSTLLNLEIAAIAADSTSNSNVDGLPGIRITNGRAELESATVSASLAALPNLLFISLWTAPEELMFSNSNVTGHGVGGPDGLDPTAASNLLATSSNLAISVLGLNLGVGLDTLVKGVESTFNVLLDTRVSGTGTFIEGTVRLLADHEFTIPATGTDEFFAFAEAIGLQINLDLDVQQWVGGLLSTDLNLISNVIINDTSAMMLTPEPGKAALLVLGALGLVLRRRRR